MKKASFATYEALLHTHVLPAFGDATSISEGDLQDFVLEKLDMGYSLGTVQQIVLVARMVLRHGAEKGLCEKPDWCIRYPARHAGRPLKLFSLEDQRLILRAVLENPNPRAFGIYLALASGMRMGRHRCSGRGYPRAEHPFKGLPAWQGGARHRDHHRHPQNPEFIPRDTHLRRPHGPHSEDGLRPEGR